MKSAWLTPVVLFAGCASTEIAEGEGRGLVAVDEKPDDGTETFPRPEWQEGDQFVYRRGGVVRLEYGVSVANEAGYSMQEARSGIVVRLDRDLGQLGQELEGTDELTMVLAPADPQFTWPLWVGKKWQAHFLRKGPGGGVLPVLASYHCDAREPLTVPAGTFDCLRIWRHTRPAVEGTFLEQYDVFWYAPDVGYFVRRLKNNTMTELERFHRQTRSSEHSR